MEWREVCAGLLVTGLLCFSGCGSSGNSSGDDTLPADAAAGVDQVQVDQVDEAVSPGEVVPAGSSVVGPAGGQVAIDDPASELSGAAVDVPAGAVDEEVEISIGQAPEAAQPALLEMAGPIVQFGPSGLSFGAPATVTIPTSLTESEQELALMLTASDGDGEYWEVLDGAQFDPAAGTISAQVDHFSMFWAMKAPAIWPEWKLQIDGENFDLESGTIGCQDLGVQAFQADAGLLVEACGQAMIRKVGPPLAMLSPASWGLDGETGNKVSPQVDNRYMVKTFKGKLAAFEVVEVTGAHVGIDYRYMGCPGCTEDEGCQAPADCPDVEEACVSGECVNLCNSNPLGIAECGQKSWGVGQDAFCGTCEAPFDWCSSNTCGDACGQMGVVCGETQHQFPTEPLTVDCGSCPKGACVDGQCPDSVIPDFTSVKGLTVSSSGDQFALNGTVDGKSVIRWYSSETLQQSAEIEAAGGPIAGDDTLGHVALADNDYGNETLRIYNQAGEQTAQYVDLYPSFVGLYWDQPRDEIYVTAGDSGYSKPTAVKRLAVTRDGGKVINLTAVQTYAEDKGHVGVSASPNGEFVAGWKGTGGDVKVWNKESGDELLALGGDSGGISQFYRAYFIADKFHVVAFFIEPQYETGLRIYDTATWEAEGTIPLPELFYPQLSPNKVSAIPSSIAKVGVSGNVAAWPLQWGHVVLRDGISGQIVRELAGLSGEQNFSYLSFLGKSRLLTRPVNASAVTISLTAQ
jgi:hypothetical protein